jgi:hypothetical protein
MCAAKATGLDDISVKLLKITSDEIVDIYLNFFNWNKLCSTRLFNAVSQECLDLKPDWLQVISLLFDRYS